MAEAIAIARIALCSGLEGKPLETLLQYPRHQDTGQYFCGTLADTFDKASFALVPRPCAIRSPSGC